VGSGVLGERGSKRLRSAVCRFRSVAIRQLAGSAIKKAGARFGSEGRSEVRGRSCSEHGLEFEPWRGGDGSATLILPISKS
jgi:hypothetical protein